MPRGGIDFEGIGQKNVSVLLEATIVVDDIGKAVTWTDNGEVGLGNDGDPLAGKLIQFEDDGYGTLAYAGFLELPCLNGAEPTLNNKVVVDGAGNVKDDPGQAIDEGGAAQVVVISKGRGLVASVDADNDTCVVQL